MGMAKRQKNSDKQEATEMIEKSHEQEAAEVGGKFFEQGITDDEDSGISTYSTGENRYPGWPGMNVFRMLIPTQKLGALIGHNGERIRRICKETKACVRVIGCPLGAAERAVIIFAKEHPDELIPPAVNALLKVHEYTVNSAGLDGESIESKISSMIMTRILTPSSQAASLIGEMGSTITSIKKASNTNIHVLGNDLSLAALQGDKVVEIRGLPAEVHKALELVASHLRKYLVHESVIPLFDSHMPMRVSHMDIPPSHCSDHPQDPLHAFDPGYYPVCAGDLQYEPPWTDTCYSGCEYPMGKLPYPDIFNYRQEASSPVGAYWAYRSVTTPCHGASAYGQEVCSPTAAYRSEYMEMHPHHNVTAYRQGTISPMEAYPSATVERIYPLISIYERQEPPLRGTYQSAERDKHPHLGRYLCGSEAPLSELSPLNIETPIGRAMFAYGQEAPPPLKTCPSAAMENLVCCGVSVYEHDELLHVGVPSSTSSSPAPAVTSQTQVPVFYAEAVIGPTGARIEYIRRVSRTTIKIKAVSEEGVMSIKITGSSATDVQTAEQLIKNFMAEAAAASPGHNYDFIPSYLPAPESPAVNTLTTSHTSRVCSLTKQRLQMIY